MEIGINSNYLRRQYGTDKPRADKDCFVLCANAGLRVLDHTVYYGDEHWADRAAAAAAAAEEVGVVLYQSHAPFNRYDKRPTEEHKLLVNRALEAAARMHNEYLVVHADEYYPTPAESYSLAGGIEAMYDYWAPVVEKASALGVKVAMETLFEDGGKPYPTRFTSKLEELVGLIDRFNSPTVVCCWDSGHARLSFSDKALLDSMRTLGSRIACTHIHDNYYAKDLHLLPFVGKLNWAGHMQTLAEIGYGGHLIFEFVYGNRPDALLPAFLSEARRTGEMLLEMFEKAK